MCLIYAFGEQEKIGRHNYWKGYKSFKLRGNGILSDKFQYELNKRLFANSLDLEVESKCEYRSYYTTENIGLEKYESGFHVFLNIDDAKQYELSISYRVCPVYFRDIICFGFNGDNHYEPIGTISNGLTIVAHEMFIKRSDFSKMLEHNRVKSL